MIGEKLGQYEIVEEIGKGGMATVYRAYQPSIGRFVAIKVIHRAFATDPRALERFQREARLIARLEHPHLLPVYDYDGTKDPPYIVMRYLDGGTLKDILDHGPLPLPDMYHIIRQVAAALDYAHRQGVIHRDIKPSNIMVDADGNAFLMDFGIARLINRSTHFREGLTQTGFAVGTPGYMSPEQGMGLDEIDHRADLYALGVMVYQLVTNQMPYTAETPLALVMKHINEPIPSVREINPDLPPALDAAIQRAMAKKPEDRYDTATDFADDIARALGRATISLRPDVLRRAARASIDALNERRTQNRDQVRAALEKFEAQRHGEATMSGADGPRTLLEGGTPTVLVSMETPIPPGETKAAHATRVDERGRQPETAEASSSISAAVPAATQQPPAARRSRAGWWLIALASIASGALLLLARPSGDEAVRLTETAAVSMAGASATPTRGFVAALAATQTAAATRYGETLTAAAQTLTAAPTLATEEIDPTAASPATRTLPLIFETLTVTRVETISPSGTPSRTPTSAPTDTLTATGTSTSTTTPTPATPIAVPARDLVARGGPGSQYPPLATVAPQQPLDILGISEDGGWVLVLLPDEVQGWLALSAFISAAGDLNAVPIVAAPTDTPTVTPSPTPTATHTATPTATFTPTLTATRPAASLTPTAPPTLEGTSQPTPTFTPAAEPLGSLPYVADFEDPDPLAEWDYDPQVWQVMDEAGEHILVGQGGLRQPITVLGRQHPEWVEPQANSLVFSLRVLLDSQSAVARIIFRHSEQGYNALEIFPGLLSLKRNAPTPDLYVRENERVLQTVRAPINVNRWHTISIWIEGSRLFVYVDNALQIAVEDRAQPLLGGGEILFQVNNINRPIRFDDLIIQRPEPVSEHFQGGTIPSTWQAEPLSAVAVASEGSAAQFLRVTGPAVVAPQVRPIRDLYLNCRIWIEVGGYRLRVRSSEAGSVTLENDAGNLTVARVDSAGLASASRFVQNFYGRGRWEEVSISFVGDQLTIARDGNVRFEGTFSGSPPAGAIVFEARRGDIFRIDDCLITELVESANAAIRPFMALRQVALNRPWRLLRSDLDENFDELLRTDDWWQGGRRAAGEFITDPDAMEHRQFLRLTADNRPAWRILRPIIGTEIFGSGTDTARFSNSTDVYAAVDVRFPTGGMGGTAWLGVRVTPTVAGSDLDGYRFEIRREPDGVTYLLVRFTDSARNLVLYEALLPASVIHAPDRWVRLEALAYEDVLAFFVDGVFVTAVDGALKLGGTVALGVNAATSADFDSLIIRDTSPHDQS